MYSASYALIALLSVAFPDVPDVGQRVVAELRNGYRLEGILVEKDRRTAVLSVEAGELRLQLKQVLRFHIPQSAPPVVEDLATPLAQEVNVRLGTAKAGSKQLSLRVPAAWTKTENEDGALVYVDEKDELRLQIEEIHEEQSLWRITDRLRRAQRTELAGFDIKQERFGNRWGQVRTWEIDFEYRIDEKPFVERRLYLDFGGTKRALSFRTRAKDFTRLVGHFDRITTSLSFRAAPPAPAPVATPRGVESPEDARPATTPAEKTVPLDALHEGLEEEIRQALEKVRATGKSSRQDDPG